MFSMKKDPKSLTFEQVCEVVKGEQIFAKQFDRGMSNPPAHIADKDKPLEQWLVLMQGYLNRAIDKATIEFKPDEALEDLRIVLSLGFNAARHHGLPERYFFKAGFCRRENNYE